MIIEALARRWLNAREAFLALPAGSPDARSRLNDLAEAEDALATIVRAARIDLFTFGGQCPVQGEGFVDGKPFYFRARGQRWTMSIGGSDIIMEPEWYYEEAYGDDEFAAGWMGWDEALEFIRSGDCAVSARAANDGRVGDEAGEGAGVTEVPDDIMEAAYAHVESVKPQADRWDGIRPQWSGWAVHEAYVAGAMADRLTGPEAAVLQKLVDAWNAFVELPVEHPDQLDEFRHPFHDLQRQILARPVARSLKSDSNRSSP